MLRWSTYWMGKPCWHFWELVVAKRLNITLLSKRDFVKSKNVTLNCFHEKFRNGENILLCMEVKKHFEVLSWVTLIITLLKILQSKRLDMINHVKVYHSNLLEGEFYGITVNLLNSLRVSKSSPCSCDLLGRYKCPTMDRVKFQMCYFRIIYLL